ncbi:MAG: DUF4149 domain-containing protein [Blastocatellia bacterium]
MTDWILLFIREVSFTIWLGGLIAIDCIETPSRFRTPELTRAQAVAVGRRVFAAFNRVEIFLGLLVLSSTLPLVLREDAARGAGSFHGRASVICVCLMLLPALAQLLKLRPRLTELSRTLDLAKQDRSGPLFAEMRRLHQAYIASDILKIAAGLVALGFRSLAR